MTRTVSLEQRLSEALPCHLRLRAYHLSTPPTLSDAIFSPPPGQNERATFCESHFVGIASPQNISHANTELFLLAIEILIFTTDDLTTVFVSKADTSGFLNEVNIRPGSSSLTRAVLETVLDYLLQPRLLVDDKVVLSLFARSQNQYLFPGSIENPDKHVLDDRQLIKWWCRVLDSIWRPLDRDLKSPDAHDIGAYVVVPGCDRADTRAFFPPSFRQDPASVPRWNNAYPINFIAQDASQPLRCSIPRLPDDPKSRFLDDLDGDYIGPEGQWRNVRSLDHFWEMMSYRQECSAGRLVGFVWVVFSRSRRKMNEDDDTQTEVNSSFVSDGTGNVGLPNPAQSQVQTSQEVIRPLPDANGHDIEALPESSPPSSPVLEPSQPASSTPVHNYRESIPPALIGPSEDHTRVASVPAWPSSTKGQVIITTTDYSSLIEFLLELDFAGKITAASSTHQFIEQANKYAAAYSSSDLHAGTESTSFGITVTGQKKPESGFAQNQRTPKQEVASPHINMLSGGRKKRKVEPNGVSKSGKGTGGDNGEAKVLSSGLVRKKVKTISESVEETETGPQIDRHVTSLSQNGDGRDEVKALDSLLVRKKVKLAKSQE